MGSPGACAAPAAHSSLGGCVRTGSAIPKLLETLGLGTSCSTQGDVLAAVCRAQEFECRVGDFMAFFEGLKCLIPTWGWVGVAVSGSMLGCGAERNGNKAVVS